MGFVVVKLKFQVHTPVCENRVYTRESSIVAAGEDTQHTAQRGHGIEDLMRLHDFEGSVGIESVSRANQAAAFAKSRARCATA